MARPLGNGLWSLVLVAVFSLANVGSASLALTRRSLRQHQDEKHTSLGTMAAAQSFSTQGMDSLMALRPSNNHDRSLLTVELIHGLGNQLFQVAALISSALDQQPKFAVALPDVSRVTGNRSTYWQSVMKKLQPFVTDLAANSTRVAQSAPNAHGKSCTVEQVPHFDPFGKNCSVATVFDPVLQSLIQASSGCNTVTLRGYFQNSAYFARHLSVIRQIFWDDDTAKLAAILLADLVPRAHNQSLVSIHYRLGDYDPNGWVLDRDYYDQALLELQRRRSCDLVCLIFSDEPARAWQRSSALEGCARRVLVPANVSDATSFHMMAMTDASVLADSTFSYFAGGVLARGGDNRSQATCGNSNATRLVVAPKIEGPHAACWSYLQSSPEVGSDSMNDVEWIAVPAKTLSSSALLADETLELMAPDDS